MDPATGVFAWTAQQSHANTTNQISIIVTDNGVPPRDDTKAFLVTVLPAPFIESIALADDTVTLVWGSIPGVQYRVEYTSALDQNSWDELPGDVTATGSTASKIDTISLPSQRFYRVRVLP